MLMYLKKMYYSTVYRQRAVFKFHSTATVFVFLTAWAVGAKILARERIGARGSKRIGARRANPRAREKKKSGMEFDKPIICFIYIYQYGLPKPSNVSNGPRTAPVRPGRHRGARSVRRESDATRICLSTIYFIRSGAVYFFT